MNEDRLKQVLEHKPLMKYRMSIGNYITLKNCILLGVSMFGYCSIKMSPETFDKVFTQPWNSLCGIPIIFDPTIPTDQILIEP